MIPNTLTWNIARFLPVVIAAGLAWTLMAPGKIFWIDLWPVLRAMAMGRMCSEEMMAQMIKTGLRVLSVVTMVTLWVRAMSRSKVIFGVVPRFWVWHPQPRPDTLWERVMLETVSFRRALGWVAKSKLRPIPWLPLPRRTPQRLL